MTRPEDEDWGWYSDIDWHGREYMLGASAEHGEEDRDNKQKDWGNEQRDWVFQVVKQRSLKEKLLGREKMTAEDECLKFFKDMFEADPEFQNIEMETVR